MNQDTILKDRYESAGKSLDFKATATDQQLRELEIETALDFIKDGDHVLDVGCGLGYPLSQFATYRKISAVGIDYADTMVQGAKKLQPQYESQLKGTVNFELACVTELPYSAGTFDVVTSGHCLMALLEWDKQKKALTEIHRVLKPGGLFIMMEGTFDGLERLNEARTKFSLSKIEADGKDRFRTLKFRESELLDFCKPYFIHEETKRFGMYYFLTRIVQPLLVAPNPPSYDHKINEVARIVSKHYPDFNGLGHLVAFVFSKRS